MNQIVFTISSICLLNNWSKLISNNLLWLTHILCFSEYLATICQNLYDVLRPSLITINHLEVLTELCTILKEMLNVENQNNGMWLDLDIWYYLIGPLVALDQFMEITNQLLQDVAERLVFRANVFFQHDLSAYEPSPGDLAYPEKLEYMEVVICK